MKLKNKDFFLFFTSPLMTLLYNLVATTLAIIGITQYKNDMLFLLIYITPFITTIMLTIFIGILKRRCDILKRKENAAFKFLFSDNLKKLLATLKDSQNILWNSYIKFCESVDLESVTTEETEADIEVDVDEEVLRTFYRDIKKASDTMFSTIVESLKRVVEYNINTINEGNSQIAVCIKQLNRCHKKQGRQVPDDLQAFAIFRDKYSYEHSREIGSIYTVNANTPFRSCIQADNPREAYYIENDILKALHDGRYECENKAELIANKAYTATMVVPITQNVVTDKFFYGFLCIDTVSDEDDTFIKEELLALMQSYSDVLATYYHLVNMYFPFIFDYVYHQNKAEKGEVK